MARRNEPGMAVQRGKSRATNGGVVGEHNGDRDDASGGDDRAKPAGLVSESFALLMLRVDGWLRVVPHDLGKVVYFKWKFTTGRWRGFYVMYRCDDYDYQAALDGLVYKLLEVEKGHHRPARDTPYGDDSA